MAKIKRMQYPLGHWANPERMAYPKMTAGEDLKSYDIVSLDGKKATATIGMGAFGFVRTDTQNLKTVYTDDPFAVVSKAMVYLDETFAVGTKLFLALDGSITDTAPTVSGQMVQPIGVVMQLMTEDKGATSNMAFLDFNVLLSEIIA